jgi:hypothetical protein
MLRLKQTRSFFRWIADRHFGARIEHFADLFGTTMGHSNGVMLEHASARCKLERERPLRHD